jgi:uncharacterized protein (TIGR02145 family)
MKNQTISLKLSVLDSSSTGAAVYMESHTAATNGSGHFAIQIGGGTALLGTFDSVGWANGRNKYLKTELSQNGTWVNLGISQLVSVPYALHAGSASYSSQAGTLRDSAGNIFSVGYSNGQPTLVAAPGSGSASNPGSFACGQSVTYAGESYPTVQIGNQCWFQKNLNVGTMINSSAPVDSQRNNGVKEKYCYDNDTANCSIFGGLYQRAEAVEYQNTSFGKIQGICPEGWHIPNDVEWNTLKSFLGDSSTAGGTIKSTSGLWTSPNTGATNSSRFSALPGGYRYHNGTFINKGTFTYFWSTSRTSNTYSHNHGLSNLSSNFSINYFEWSFSVRCLKD